MRRPSGKITLRRAMALVCLSGLALALLRHALRHWGPGEVTTLALTILLATNVLAWFQRARWQVFWAGFGIFGWAYLAISLGSSAGDLLPTTSLLDALHDRLISPPYPPGFFADFDEIVEVQTHGERFRRAGHSVISLVFALLGGIGASLLFPGRREDVAGEARPPEGSLLKPGRRMEPRDGP